MQKLTRWLTGVAALLLLLLSACKDADSADDVQLCNLKFSLPEGVDECFISGVKSSARSESDNIVLNLTADRSVATGDVLPQRLSDGEFTVTIVCSGLSYSTSVPLDAFMAGSNYTYILSIYNNTLMLGTYSTVIGFEETETIYIDAVPE